jgi:hypothetical protein
LLGVKPGIFGIGIQENNSDPIDSSAAGAGGATGTAGGNDFAADEVGKLETMEELLRDLSLSRAL